MKTPFENPEFCRETFSLPENFREAAIAGMSRVGRRRRQVRRAGSIGIVAMLVAMTFTLTREAPVSEPVVVKIATPTWFVRSAPLPESMIVRTDPSASLEIISDEQLLALARDHSIGLIRTEQGLEVLLLDSNLIQTQ